MTEAAHGTVGTRDTRLIVLRGNSASGKSSVASGLREKFGRDLAAVRLTSLQGAAPGGVRVMNGAVIAGVCRPGTAGGRSPAYASTAPGPEYPD